MTKFSSSFRGTAAPQRERRRLRRAAALALGLLAVLLVPSGLHLLGVFDLRSQSGPATADATAKTAPAATTEGAQRDSTLPSPSRRALLGEVLTAAGRPIAGCNVRVLLEGGAVEAAVTDDAGGFFFDGLPRAPREVRFQAEGFDEVVVGRSELPDVPEAFWSQVLRSSSSAAPEELAGTRIEGTVVARGGGAVGGFRVIVGPADERQRRRRPVVLDVNDGSGAFRAPVKPGRSSVTVVADGFRPSPPLVVDVAENEVEKVRIMLEPSTELRGRVTDAETGRPVTGALVALVGVRGLAPVSTNAEGRFIVRTLPEENANLVVSAEGYTALNAGGVDGRRSRDQTVELALSPARDGVTSEVVGIGVAVERAPDGVLVRVVYPGSPAAGLLVPGDVIVEVDGVAASGRALRDNMGAIRGPEGSSVRLVVLNEAGARRDVTLERRRVAVPAG